VDKSQKNARNVAQIVAFLCKSLKMNKNPLFGARNELLRRSNCFANTALI